MSDPTWWHVLTFGMMTGWIGFGVAVEACDRRLKRTLDLLGVKKLGPAEVSVKLDLELEEMHLGNVKAFFLGNGPSLQEAGDAVREESQALGLRDADDDKTCCGTCKHFDFEPYMSFNGTSGGCLRNNLSCTFDDWVCNRHEARD